MKRLSTSVLCGLVFGALAALAGSFVPGEDLAWVSLLEASRRLLTGVNPYLPPGPGSTWFQGPPFQAFAGISMLMFAEAVRRPLFLAVSGAVLGWSWERFRGTTASRWWERTGPYVLIALGAREATTTFLAVACLLMAIAWRREAKLARVGAAATMAAVLDARLALLAVLLAAGSGRRSRVAAFVAAIVAYALPAPILPQGGAELYALHVDWLATVARGFSDLPLWDLGSRLTGVVPDAAVELVRLSLMIATGLGVGLAWLRCRNGAMPWAEWVAFAGAGVVLLDVSAGASKGALWLAQAPLILAVFWWKSAAPGVALVVWAWTGRRLVLDLRRERS